MPTERDPAPATRAPSKKGASKKDGGGSFRAFLKRRHDPLTSLLLTIPVFLIYHLGILLPWVHMRNGVDFVSVATLSLLQESMLGYLGLTLGYCVAIGVAVAVLRRRGSIKPAEFLPMLGESAILALIMSFTVGWATAKLFSWQAGPPPMNPIEKLVMAAGAGFHEELIFRVILFAGGAFALRRLAKMTDGKAALIAGLVSSVLFSAVHYVGSFGDDFQIVSFGFRFLAGLYLAAVYRYRGFAVAVYTHAIYDVIVFYF